MYHDRGRECRPAVWAHPRYDHHEGGCICLPFSRLIFSQLHIHMLQLLPVGMVGPPIQRAHGPGPHPPGAPGIDGGTAGVLGDGG